MKVPLGKRSAVTSVVALMVGVSVANASGIPVIDLPNTFQSTLNQINTYSQRFQDAYEYGQTATRWMQTWNHYRQQLIKIQGIVMSLGLPQAQRMTKVEPSYMVAERCGGGGLGALSRTFRLNPDGSLLEQQRQICVNIQQMENARYNYTIEFLQEYLPELNRELKQIEAQRNASSEEGNVMGVDSNSLQVSNGAEANFQTWRANMDAYDSYINAMKENQRLLARVAMKGRGSPLGAMVKTAALKGALEAGR